MAGIQRSFWVAFAVTLAAIAGGSAPASAQTYPWRNADFRIETEGTGRLQASGLDSDVRRVTVFLRRDGRAEVTLGDYRHRTELSGRWRDDSGDRDFARLRLDLDGRVNDDRVRGDARLVLRRVVSGLSEQWSVARLMFSADGRDSRFSAEFRARDYTSSDDDRWGNDDRRDDRGNGGRWDDDRDQERWNGGGDRDRLNQFSGEARGDGTLRDGRDRRDLDRAYVRLERGGRAEITVYGRTTERFEGRWRRRDDDTADIRLTRAFGRDVRDGRGRIEFRTWNGREIRLRSLELSGQAPASGRDRNREFDVHFSRGRSDDDYNDRPGNGGGGPSDSIAIETSRPGRGTLRTNGRDDMTVRRVSVVLRKNGQAQITLDGDRGDRQTISGRWIRNSEDRYQISVAGALGNNNANGSGQLTLRRGRDVERLQLGGLSSGRAWALDFTAD